MPSRAVRPKAAEALMPASVALGRSVAKPQVKRMIAVYDPHTLLPLHLGQQPEHDRPRHLVLLQVDQQLAEAPYLRVHPELG